MFDLLPYYDTINPPFWQGGISPDFFKSSTCFICLLVIGTIAMMLVSMVSLLDSFR